MSTDNEEWEKVVIGFTTYEVSTLGRVRSTGPKPRFYKPRCLKQGAPVVFLATADMRGNKIGVTRSVSRLVAEAFIPNPMGLPMLKFKDGDKYNSAVSNLVWVNYARKKQTVEDRAYAAAVKAGAVITAPPGWVPGQEVYIPIKPVAAPAVEDTPQTDKWKVSLQAAMDTMTADEQRAYWAEMAEFGSKPPERLKLKI